MGKNILDFKATVLILVMILGVWIGILFNLSSFEQATFQGDNEPYMVAYESDELPQSDGFEVREKNNFSNRLSDSVLIVKGGRDDSSGGRNLDPESDR